MATDIDLPAAAQAEALFTSDLSAFTHHTQATVEAAIRRAIRAHGGIRGCAGEAAAAYGEHPETAAPRMRWARAVVEGILRPGRTPGPAAAPGLNATPAGFPVLLPILPLGYQASAVGGWPLAIAGPRCTGKAPDTARRTVLLTGASGVVGRAVLHRLRDVNIVCLVHRSPVSGPNVTTVQGDISKRMFGLAEQTYMDLAANVDAVIHCAEITDFNRVDGNLEATNIMGTEHMAAFAAEANAVLYHVSTAFVDAAVDGDRGVRKNGNTDSIAMIIAAVGDPAKTDPHACDRLAELCGDLPLALDIAARKLAARPDIPLRRITGRLGEPRALLDWLCIEDLSVRESLNSAYLQLHDLARALLHRLARRCADDSVTWADGSGLGSAARGSVALVVDELVEELDEPERRVFRQLSVVPGPFTLAAAEAVARQDAGPAVLHLVDCSLLVPPRAGPDGRSRYVLLETLRAYAGLLTETGEQQAAAAALAGYALEVAEDAAAGLQTSTGEVAAARRLDAEDATLRQALAWAMDHDAAIALGLAVALAPWWALRGRLAGHYALLCEAAGRAIVGSDGWCAAQVWLGAAAFFSADPAGALGHFTAVRDAIGDRAPSRALVNCLAGRSVALRYLGRIAEAADDGRRALAMAEQVGYPAGEALALVGLSMAAYDAGDLGSAVQLAWQTGQIPAGIPGWIARVRSNLLTGVLTAAGDLAAAERSCADGLARSREAGDLWNLPALLVKMAILDLRAGRTEDAAAHLRETLQIAARAGLWL